MLKCLFSRQHVCVYRECEIFGIDGRMPRESTPTPVVCRCISVILAFVTFKTVHGMSWWTRIARLSLCVCMSGKKKNKR